MATPVIPETSATAGLSPASVAAPHSQPPLPRRPPPWQRRPWLICTSLVLLACLVLIGSAEYILRNAEPILRKRITATLASRFHAPVTLDGLDISLFRGIEVRGRGLRIGYAATTIQRAPNGSMIAVRQFAFRTGLRALVGDTLAHRPLHIADVRVEGLDLHIPPLRNRDEPEPDREPREPEKYVVVVDRLSCEDVRLFLETGKQTVTQESGPPAAATVRKPPLEFDISNLALENVGRHQAMRFDAQLVNARPVGAIHASGHFGPWAGDTGDTLDRAADHSAGEPGDTPIDGQYRFDHADLGTVRGIAGTLSSAGHFAGTLDRIVVDGHTDTPNFSLAIAGHPMPLHTDFHAVVDGTNGDTRLEPVHAVLGGSAFTTRGEIVKVKGLGHDIQLEIAIPHGRMEDFLRLAVKTSPPLLNGTLSMRATLHIPPGGTPVPEKMAMAGDFDLSGVQFSNPRWQDRIDGLSARAQGRPEEANAFGNDHRAETASRLAAHFTLNHGVMGITGMHYALPGALVLMNGVYSADGKLFEFKGHVRTDATASQMIGGWKGLLLSPFDHFLQKNGAGVELPVEISGTGGDLHFGLPGSGVDDKPTQLLADIKGKARAQQQFTTARSLATQAAAEDTAAAAATTLEEAQRHHKLAVRLREEARQDAQPSTTNH